MESHPSWRSWRPSPAMAVSMVSLFVALSGTALALQRNSVGPRHIKADAVRSKHIKDDNLKGRDIAGVPWGKLTSVPSGFADGIDNTGGGGPTSNLVCSGCVGASDLGTASVIGSKLAGNSVTGAKVADDSLTASDLGPGSVRSSEIAGSQVRAAELGQIINRTGAAVTVPPNATGPATASCGPFERMLSGGASWDVTSTSTHLVQSAPTSPSTWHVRGANVAGVSRLLRAHVLCLVE